MTLLLAQESCIYSSVLGPDGVLLLENAEANVIYLETPAGVGYSYSTDVAYYHGVDDKMTSIELSFSAGFIFYYLCSF